MGLDVDFGNKTVVPMPRTGVFVDFKAKPITGAVLKLVTEDGTEVPVGAKVTVKGVQETYEVVLHGEVYVPELSYPASLRVEWENHACQAVVPTPPTVGEIMPRLGPIVCRGLQ